MAESIYNLIPREGGLDDAPSGRRGGRGGPRYRSQFADKVKAELSPRKGPGGGTMGPKVTVDSTQFLKRGGGTRHVAEPQKKDRTKTKPRPPGPHDTTTRPARQQKDFIKTNAVHAITAVPTKKEGIVIDGAGQRFDAGEAGLLPKYSKKKDFGKTPAYLTKKKQQEAADREAYEHYAAEAAARNSPYYQVSEQERQQLVRGLKANWEQLHHEYQSLPVLADTAAKKHKRAQMEAQLNQIEKDIERLEKHTIILVDQTAY
eukprot:m.292081 g.292081  ORF g.292081 m.292081 type:complete len:260 (-) comp12564_c0_seq1:225-1004(-)